MQTSVYGVIHQELSIRTSTQALSRQITSHLNPFSRKSLLRQLVRRLFGRSRKRTVRYGIFITQALALIAVVGVVLYGSEIGGQNLKQNALMATTPETVAANPLDQLSSADVAEQLARLGNFEERIAVINHADTVNSQLNRGVADELIVTKPQVVATETLSNKDIKTYVVKNGDSLADLAARFGVTSDSIRWSNGLSGSYLRPGTKLYISPISNGVVYKVKSGDTVKALAERFRSSEEKIITFNDAEIAGLKAGDRIVIPDGSLPAPSAPSYTGLASNLGTRGRLLTYGGNGYDYGWCTWHVANRRSQIGRPIPNHLGNAISWYNIARNAGLPVGGEPKVGAVLWHANIGGLGHVAFVESRNDDGSFEVSDMNYPYWGRVTTRTITPDEFGNYRFIY